MNCPDRTSFVFVLLASPSEHPSEHTGLRHECLAVTQDCGRMQPQSKQPNQAEDLSQALCPAMVAACTWPDMQICGHLCPDLPSVAELPDLLLQGGIHIMDCSAELHQDSHIPERDMAPTSFMQTTFRQAP